MKRHPAPSLASTLRAAVLPIALCVAAGGVQAQLLGNLLVTTTDAVTGTITTTVSSLTEVLADAAPANHAARRDASVVAAKASTCRILARHRGEQRVSYGTASPRSRQLLNDCTPMGAPTTP